MTKFTARTVRAPLPAAAGGPAHTGGRPRRRRVEPADVFIGAVGWLLAIGAIMAMLTMPAQQRRESARVTATFRADVAALQEEAAAAAADLSRQRTDLANKANTEVDAQGKLDTDRQLLAKSVADLTPEVAELEQAASKVGGTVKAEREEVEFTQAGLEELKQKVADLEKRRLRLLADYDRRFAEMKAQFEAKLARPEPELLRQFYNLHRHTPFAPAAGYHAGEKLFAKGRPQDALRLYQEVVERYPESIYAKLADSRAAQIRSRMDYAVPETPVEFEPYKALTER